ncbi:MAG: plasmid mobilization protein [Ruminiclostridium sp.]
MEKNLDQKGRWRNVTVAFRMSQEESDDLNCRVKLSGLKKQDYIISRLTEREVVVQGNPRVYRALRNEMVAILSELKRMEQYGDVDDEFLSLLRLVMETVNGMKE